MLIGCIINRPSACVVRIDRQLFPFDFLFFSTRPPTLISCGVREFGQNEGKIIQNQSNVHLMALSVVFYERRNSNFRGIAAQHCRLTVRLQR
jgi:hypothetical protein